MREWIGMGLEIGIYSPDFPILLGDLKRGMRQKDDDRNRNRNKRQRQAQAETGCEKSNSIMKLQGGQLEIGKSPRNPRLVRKLAFFFDIFED